MMLQNKETNATSQHTGRETDTDTATYPVPQLTGNQRGVGTYTNWATGTKPTNGVAEAVLVTLLVGVLSLGTQVVWAFAPLIAARFALSAASITNVLGVASFVISVAIALVVGFAVGSLANRGTLVRSLLIANVVNFAVWEVVNIVFLPQQFAGNAQIMTTILLQSLLGTATITAAEIGLALLLARTRRVSP